MNKFIVLSIVFMSTSASGQSIQIERQLLGSSGESKILGNIIYDWSLGEVIIDQSQTLYTQGFQQYIDFSNSTTKKTNINFNTIITPGDNDKNNYLVFDNLPIHSELNIYDKWNNNLFNKKDYDGTFEGISNSGKFIQDGVYIYLLSNEMGIVFLKGTITIKRK